MSTYVDALERWDDHGPNGDAGVPHRQGEAVVSTAYMRLRERLDRGAEAPHIAFVGVNGRERAADVARGYAHALTVAGKRVLLVDLAPVGASADGNAFLETLLESGKESPALASSGGPGLVVIESSPRLQSRPRAFEAKVMEWLSVQAPHFDRVVLHVGAVLADASAPVVAVWAGRAALVVRAHWTSRRQTIEARDRLRAAEVNVVGAVLGEARSLPGFIERANRWLQGQAGNAA